MVDRGAEEVAAVTRDDFHRRPHCGQVTVGVEKIGPTGWTFVVLHLGYYPTKREIERAIKKAQQP